MNTTALLTEVQRRGLRLVADGDRLRCRGPQEAITPDLVASLRQHKPELLAALQSGATSATTERKATAEAAVVAELERLLAAHRGDVQLDAATRIVNPPAFLAWAREVAAHPAPESCAWRVSLAQVHGVVARLQEEATCNHAS